MRKNADRCAGSAPRRTQDPRPFPLPPNGAARFHTLFQQARAARRARAAWRAQKRSQQVTATSGMPSEQQVMQMSPQQSASSRSFEIDQTQRHACVGVDRDQQARRFDDALGNGHVVVAAVVAWQASVATQPRDARRSRPRVALIFVIAARTASLASLLSMPYSPLAPAHSTATAQSVNRELRVVLHRVALNSE